MTMPTFATDPDELEDEIREIPICFEPMNDDLHQLSARDQELFVSSIRKGGAYDKRVLADLKYLAGKYPGVPSIKNNLMATLISAGKVQMARKLLDEIVRDHPDYLFGRVNMAHLCTDSPDQICKVPSWLGDTLRLCDFKPGTSLFHITEVRSFYVAVASFHLKSGRVEPARRIHEVLVDLTDEIEECDLQLAKLGDNIARASLQSLLKHLAEEKNLTINVKTPPLPAASTVADRERPVFHHAETAILYERGLELTADEVETLRSLPRESFVADLEAVLRDACARSPLFLEDQDFSTPEGSWFAIHAFLFLGDLEAKEALPAVLECLSLPDEALDFWFSDLLFDAIPVALQGLLKADLEAVTPWLLSPGITAKGRAAFFDAAVLIVQRQPERRAEVLDWFRRLLNALLDVRPEDNILSTHLISFLVTALCKLGAHELTDLVAAHYEKGHVSRMFHGTMDHIRSELFDSPAEPAPLAELSLADLYEELASTYSDSEDAPAADASAPVEKLQASPGPFPPFSARTGMMNPPVSFPPRKAVVGRNDPCPCGSGKKFKKCCGAVRV